MNRKEIIISVRGEGKLKGMKPAYVLLGKNGGHIYTEGSREYIMSISKNRLYFQRLSRFFKLLKPKDDFTLDLNKFRYYQIIDKRVMKTLFLMAEDKRLYMEINYACTTADTCITVDNIARMCRDFEALGMKDLAKEVADGEEGAVNSTEESHQEVRNEASDEK